MAKQRKHPGCAVCSYVSMTAPLQSLSVTTLGSNPAMRKRDESSVQSPIMSPIESRPAPRPRRKLSGKPHFLAALCRLAHHACIWPWFTAEDMADGGGLDRSAVCAVKGSDNFAGPPWACVQTLPVPIHSQSVVLSGPTGPLLTAPLLQRVVLHCNVLYCAGSTSPHVTSPHLPRRYAVVLGSSLWCKHLGHGACSMCRHIRVR